MSSIQQKMSRNTRNQENMTHNENKLIVTGSVVTSLSRLLALYLCFSNIKISAWTSCHPVPISFFCLSLQISWPPIHSVPYWSLVFFYIQHPMETLIKVLIMLAVLFRALLIRLLAAHNTSDYSFFETLFSLSFLGPYSPNFLRIIYWSPSCFPHLPVYLFCWTRSQSTALFTF